MVIRVRCPRCGYLLSAFDERSLNANKAVRRAYEHSLKNPILCAGCNTWIQRPRVDRGTDDDVPPIGRRGTPGAIR